MFAEEFPAAVKAYEFGDAELVSDALLNNLCQNGRRDLLFVINLSQKLLKVAISVDAVRIHKIRSADILIVKVSPADMRIFISL